MYSTERLKDKTQIGNYLQLYGKNVTPLNIDGIPAVSVPCPTAAWELEETTQDWDSTVGRRVEDGCSPELSWTVDALVASEFLWKPLYQIDHWSAKSCVLQTVLLHIGSQEVVYTALGVYFLKCQNFKKKMKTGHWAWSEVLVQKCQLRVESMPLCPLPHWPPGLPHSLPILLSSLWLCHCFTVFLLLVCSTLHSCTSSAVFSFWV